MTKVFEVDISEATTEEYSIMERMALRRFHPRSLFIDMAGMIWAVFYFWNHQWIEALAVLAITRVLAISSVMAIDLREFAKTTLGKVALLHLQPINLMVQATGVVILLLGLWYHTPELLLAGTSLLFLGHLFGWKSVDSRFE